MSGTNRDLHDESSNRLVHAQSAPTISTKYETPKPSDAPVQHHPQTPHRTPINNAAIRKTFTSVPRLDKVQSGFDTSLDSLLPTYPDTHQVVPPKPAPGKEAMYSDGTISDDSMRKTVYQEPVASKPFGARSSSESISIIRIMDLFMVFKTKQYYSGWIYRKNDLMPDGRRYQSRDWVLYWVEIEGPTMRFYKFDSNFALTEEDSSIKQLKKIVEPVTVNISDATCDWVQIFTKQGPNGQELQAGIFNLNSSGCNRYFLQPIPPKQGDQSTLSATLLQSRWMAAIRLSNYDEVLLNQIYTCSLLQTRPDFKAVEDYFFRSSDSGPVVSVEGYLQVRLAGTTEWRQLYCIVEQRPATAQSNSATKFLRRIGGSRSNSLTNRPVFGRGHIIFFRDRAEADKSRKGKAISGRRVLLSADASSRTPKVIEKKSKGAADLGGALFEWINLDAAFSVFPEKRDLVSISTLFKIEGGSFIIGGKGSSSMIIARPPADGDESDPGTLMTPNFALLMARTPIEMFQWICAIWCMFQMKPMEPNEEQSKSLQLLRDFEKRAMTLQGQPLPLNVEDLDSVEMQTYKKTEYYNDILKVNQRVMHERRFQKPKPVEPQPLKPESIPSDEQVSDDTSTKDSNNEEHVQPETVQQIDPQLSTRSESATSSTEEDDQAEFASPLIQRVLLGGRRSSSPPPPTAVINATRRTSLAKEHQVAAPRAAIQESLTKLSQELTAQAETPAEPNDELSPATRLRVSFQHGMAQDAIVPINPIPESTVSHIIDTQFRNQELINAEDETTRIYSPSIDDQAWVEAKFSLNNNDITYTPTGLPAMTKTVSSHLPITTTRLNDVQSIKSKTSPNRDRTLDMTLRGKNETDESKSQITSTSELGSDGDMDIKPALPPKVFKETLERDAKLRSSSHRKKKVKDKHERQSRGMDDPSFEQRRRQSSKTRRISNGKQPEDFNASSENSETDRSNRRMPRRSAGTQMLDSRNSRNTSGPSLAEGDKLAKERKQIELELKKIKLEREKLQLEKEGIQKERMEYERAVSEIRSIAPFTGRPYSGYSGMFTSMPGSVYHEPSMYGSPGPASIFTPTGSNPYAASVVSYGGQSFILPNAAYPMQPNVYPGQFSMQDPSYQMSSYPNMVNRGQQPPFESPGQQRLPSPTPSESASVVMERMMPNQNLLQGHPTLSVVAVPTKNQPLPPPPTTGLISAIAEKQNQVRSVAYNPRLGYTHAKLQNNNQTTGVPTVYASTFGANNVSAGQGPPIGLQRASYGPQSTSSSSSNLPQQQKQTLQVLIAGHSQQGGVNPNQQQRVQRKSLPVLPTTGSSSRSSIVVEKPRVVSAVIPSTINAPYLSSSEDSSEEDSH